MKKLSILLLALSIPTTYANELANISLLTPVSYTLDQSIGDTTVSKAMLLTASLVKIDIKKKVTDKIAPYEKDLLPFFKNKAEYNNYINQTIDRGMTTHLTSVNDQNLQTFLKYIGNDLIGGIASKVLENQGVKEEANRKRWTQKLTTPFNTCMNNAKNAMFDGLHCVNALTSSVVPSMGVAVVYEMSQSKLASSVETAKRSEFNKSRVDEYKACMKPTKGSSDNVMDCALSSIATGVRQVALPSLTKTINTKVPNQETALEIRKLVWNDFSTCTNQVGKNKADATPPADQFNNCLDGLVAKSGKLVVLDTIKNTKPVVDAFGKAGATSLADVKSAEFEKCAIEQKRKNNRNAQGLINTDPCENKVTNDVTYEVVTHTLKAAAQTSFPGNTKISNQVGNAGIAKLKSCWKPEQNESQREACLKSTITGYAQDIASIKIDGAVGPEVKNKNQIKTQALSGLKTCLAKELPSNISKANNITADIDKCSNGLTLQVAQTVAEAQIRNTATGLMSPKEVNDLVAKKVKGDFTKCLGKTPTDAKITQCGNALTVSAALDISKAAFKKEVESFIKANGGLSALGLTQAQIDDFLKKLNADSKICIEKKSNQPAMDQVNACLKVSIKSIATYLGETKFNQSVGHMYDSRPEDKEKFKADFKKSLITCLSTKDAKNFSIDDYTKNIATCSGRIEKETTKTLATDQVDSSLNEYLKDRPGMDNSQKRKDLRNKLLSDFNSCSAKKASDTNSCVDDLKRYATRDIVLSYGRDETLAQLSSKVVPSEIQNVEKNFILCTQAPLKGNALATKLDECTRDYALAFAKELGVLKLNFALKNGLGTEDFNSNLQPINSAIINYKQCLDDLKIYNMADDLTNKIAICTKALENKGMQIVSNTFSKWMSSDKKDAATDLIKNSFASFMPCLSVLLPSSPYTPEMQENIESIMKPVMKLLAGYIEYNPENAQQTLAGIMSKLKVDLNDAASTLKAKAEILDMIYKEGTLDQFLKSVVRGEVMEAFKNVSEDDIPQSLRGAMLDKENFEVIFDSPAGNQIKEDMMKDFLTPVLLQNKDMSSPEMKGKMADMQNRIIKLLIDAPTFGQAAIKVSVQNQINSMNGLKKFVARAIYGKNALEWDKVRTTPAGIQAEAYITEKILGPKFSGKQLSAQEEKEIALEAERLVTEAVKKYKK